MECEWVATVAFLSMRTVQNDTVPVGIRKKTDLGVAGRKT
jgi:hypothetical protein